MIKRSIYIINPKFQFRFAFFICFFIFISSLIYPVSIYNLFEVFADKCSSISLDILDSKKNSLIGALAIIQLAFILIVFIACIFFSHKIAGPIFKMRKFLDNIADGNPPEGLSFRKGDNFPELADSYNRAIGKIQEIHGQDFEYLVEVTSYINNLSLVVPEDKKPVLNEITNKLTAMHDRYRTR